MPDSHARGPGPGEESQGVSPAARAGERRLPLLTGRSRVRIPPGREARSSVWIERHTPSLVTRPRGRRPLSRRARAGAHRAAERHRFGWRNDRAGRAGRRVKVIAVAGSNPARSRPVAQWIEHDPNPSSHHVRTAGNEETRTGRAGRTEQVIGAERPGSNPAGSGLMLGWWTSDAPARAGDPGPGGTPARPLRAMVWKRKEIRPRGPM